MGVLEARVPKVVGRRSHKIRIPRPMCSMVNRPRFFSILHLVYLDIGESSNLKRQYISWPFRFLFLEIFADVLANSCGKLYLLSTRETERSPVSQQGSENQAAIRNYHQEV